MRPQDTKHNGTPHDNFSNPRNANPIPMAKVLRLSSLLFLAASVSASLEHSLINPPVGIEHDRLENRRSDEGSQDEVCWSSWAKYWKAPATTSTWLSSATFNRTDTSTVPIRSKISAYTTTYITVITATVTAGRSFVVSSETYLDTQSLVYTETVYSTSPSTVTSTWSSRTVYYSANTKSLTTPACALPSPYPACQSEWDAFLQNTGASSPGCTQASIGSEQCKSVIAARGGAGMLAGETALDFTTSNASSTWWPAESSFAPGCTLGCQTCAITGSTVKVFYWPSSTATAWQNGTRTATVTQGTSRDSKVVITVIDNVTLTSPTVYVSYDVLYASNSCSGLGSTYRNTIVPLSKSADLSSLVYVPYQGENNFVYTTNAFHYDDLKEPIPDSVYQQLPSCAREYQSFSIYYFGGSNTTAFTCERHGAYSPIIAIPTEVRNLDPAWKDCTAWYGGLYDPPSALQGVPVAATPTQPSSPSPTSPQPLATLTHGSPSHTHSAPVHSSQTMDPSRAQGPEGTAGPEGGESTTTNLAGFIMSAINGGMTFSQPEPAPESGDLSGLSTSAGTHDPLVTRTPKQDATTHTNPPETVHHTGSNGQSGQQPQIDGPGSTDIPSTTSSEHLVAFEAGGRTHTFQVESYRPVIDGQTFTQGQVTTLGSKVVSMGPSEVFIDGTVASDSEPTDAVALAFNGQTVTAWRDADGGVVVDGSSIGQTGLATIDGATVSIGTEGIVMGSQSLELPVPDTTTASASRHPQILLTVTDSTSGVRTLTARPPAGADPTKKVVVDGVTISQGASPESVNGLQMSLGSGGVLYTLPAFSTSDTDSSGPTKSSSSSPASRGQGTTGSSTSGTPAQGTGLGSSGARSLAQLYRGDLLKLLSATILAIMCM